MEKILIWIILVLVVLYFVFQIVSQMASRKKYHLMQDTLAAGDIVVFAGGLIGEIVELDKSTIKVKTGQAVIEADRACVQGKRKNLS